MATEVIVALISAGVTILNILITTIGSMITKVQTRKALDKATKDNELSLVKNGLRDLLRVEIVRSHDKQSEKKYCPVYAKEAITRVYKSYHELGGNDVATSLYNQLLELPTEKLEEEEK